MINVNYTMFKLYKSVAKLAQNIDVSLVYRHLTLISTGKL